MTHEKYDTNELVERLRPLVQGHATQENWQAITTLFDDPSLIRNNAARQRALTYANGAMRHWPHELRVMPESWRKFITNKKQKRPHPALALCRIVYLEREWLEPERVRTHRALGDPVFDAIAVASATHRSMGDAHLATLLSFPWIASLEVLDLMHNLVTTDGVRLLTRCEELGKLRHLNLFGNRLTYRALELFGQSECLGGLEELDLGIIDREASLFYEDSLERFAHGEGCPSLEKLNLSGHERLGDRSFEALLTSSTRQALKSLNMYRCGVSDHGLEVLRGPVRGCAQVEELSLMSNELGASGEHIPWHEYERLATVQKLSLSNNTLGEAHLIALLESGQFGSLQKLELYDVGWTPAALGALCKAHLPSLRSLYVGRSDMCIFSRGWLEQWVDSPLARQLSEVDLVGISHDHD